MTIIKNLFFALVLCLLPQLTEAVTFATQSDVFTPDVWQAPTTDHTYYGELQGWPHTYTFFIPEETAVRYTLATKRTSEPVSFLLVREITRGVEEVTRQSGEAVTWEDTRDTRLRLSLAQAPVVETTLSPGLYKLEVSNPTNSGTYQVMIGEGSTGGFWTSLQETFAVHSFYGHGWQAWFTWRALLLLVIAFGGLYWLRRLVS